MSVLSVTLAGLAAMLMSASAWCDWTRREVPNALAVALAGLWLVAAAWAPQAVGGAPAASLACGAAALAAGFVLFLPGWIGAGDGKLIAVLALWLGPQDLPLALLGAGLLLAGLTLPALAGVAPGFRERGIPVACALAPPGVAVLLSRMHDIGPLAAWQ